MVRGLVTLIGAVAAFDDESGLLQSKEFSVQDEYRQSSNHSVSVHSASDTEWWNAVVNTVSGWFGGPSPAPPPEPSPPEADGALAACLLDNGQRSWKELLDMSMDDRRNTVIQFLHDQGVDSVSRLQGMSNGALIYKCPHRVDAQRVYVGPSNSNEKCVPAGDVVECVVNAGDRGQRMNMDYHEAGDTFAVSVRDGQVCARRTDSHAGWGMQLEFRCSTKPTGTLRIGESAENKKCVPHGSVDAALQCASNAGDRGIRVNPDWADAGDRFEITTGNGQVCAKRIDSNGGWGMQLEIRCDENLDACDESLVGFRDTGYRGCQDHSVHGYRCQKWTAQTPNKHSNTPAHKPGTGLGDHNFCRNPDGDSNIWCYTKDWMERWDYCAPRKHVCDETYEGDGSRYRGCQDESRQGKKCQQWTSQSPHTHTRTAATYPDKGIGWHNFCRNPDGDDHIWCYTTDESTRWDYCDPPALHCHAHDCSNHGTTTDKDNRNGCDCLCDDGFSGTDCSIPPPCGDEVCSGHGTTTDLDATNGCDCTCTNDFRGQDCSIPPACSSEHHCNGHATLDMDSTDGCECHCADGWSGTGCNVPPPCKADLHCSGHGHTKDSDATDGCDCTCEPGFIGKDCSEPARICCRAMTADCLSCAAGITAAEYCELHPSTHGCKAPPKEPVVCCQAMLPTCLACQAGMTEKEYCSMYPAVEGCTDDIVGDC